MTDRFRRAEDTRVDKPWGYEIRWAVTDRYLGKVLHVNKGEALSLQYHREKDETLYLLRGVLSFEIGPEGVPDGALEARTLGTGDTVHIPPRTTHRMTAVEDCDLFEVSTSEIEDVVRLEDRYGRAAT